MPYIFTNEYKVTMNPLLKIISCSMMVILFSTHSLVSNAAQPIEPEKRVPTLLEKRKMIPKPIAVLHGLNKVTARVSEFEIETGDTTKFGSLLITMYSCQASDPLDQPESAVLLEIEDKKPNEMPKLVFSGWMFASSPAINSLEHPVYDVWVKECKSDDKHSSSDPA
jgi:hypothetical protein